MTTLAVELPELCRWAYMWVSPVEQAGMFVRHSAVHERQREELLRQMERGAPEEQVWAAEARAWIASHEGQWPI